MADNYSTPLGKQYYHHCPRCYPTTYFNRKLLTVHAILKEPIPIGRHRNLWSVHVPCEPINVSSDVSSEMEIVLSTVEALQPYGERIVSQFVFQSYHAMLLSPKNIGGLVVFPYLQLEYRGSLLLRVKMNHPKIKKAFKHIHSLILQNENGGTQLARHDVPLTPRVRALAEVHAWEAAKRTSLLHHG
jgi:hypothetical protein